MKTVKDLLTKELNLKEIDIISVIDKAHTNPIFDSVDHLIDKVGHEIVTDYTIEYDADEGLVYLDIYT
jgi:hypothetical protein